MTDGAVDFAGERMRPELELMTDALVRGLRHHKDHGGRAECGCPLRIDGTEPYLHRPGCPKERDRQVERWLSERDRAGLTSYEVRCKLCQHGSDAHRFGDPVVCLECPNRECQLMAPG